MKQRSKKFLGVLLSLVLVLGLIPAMALTASAGTASPYADLKNTTTTVSFNDMDWYLIDYNESTVTLFAKDSIDTGKFNEDNSAENANAYSSSAVKSYLDNLTAQGESFGDVADAIALTDLQDVGVTGAKLYLLSDSEVEAITEVEVRKMTGNYWIRTPKSDDSAKAKYVVGSTGNVSIGCDEGYVNFLKLVRPALRLDLSKVTFYSDTKTFTPGTDVTEYPLWVGGEQVTSANKDDVFKDGKVSYTPAVEDDPATADEDESAPATLTLNGYSYSGEGHVWTDGYQRVNHAAIYTEQDLTIKLTDASAVTFSSTNACDYSYAVYGGGDLSFTGTGTLTALGGKYGIIAYKNVTISGGTVNASGEEYGIYAVKSISISGGTVNVTENAERAPGIYAIEDITISGGTVIAIGGGEYSSGINTGGSITISDAVVTVTSTGEGSIGIYANQTVTIDSGEVTASGAYQAVSGAVKNTITGTGWTDAAGTKGRANIAVNTTDGQTLTYKKVQFPAAPGKITVSDAANGSVKAKIGEDEVDKANENDVVTLAVSPESGYELDTLAVSYEKATIDSLDDMVALMGDAVFTVGGSQTLTCTVQDGNFVFLDDDAVIVTTEGVTSLTGPDQNHEYKAGTADDEVYWTFRVYDGTITNVYYYNHYENDGQWHGTYGRLASAGTSTGAVIAEAALTTVTEGEEYTFSMPPYDVTVKATFKQKSTVSATVTFKVVNGKWDDDTTADKTVTLTGQEGDTLKLAADQIPAVGTKPNEGYKAGSWDVTPSTETAITENTTYTYTFTAETPTGFTVTYKPGEGDGDVYQISVDAETVITLLSAEKEPLSFTAPEGKTFKAWEIGGKEYQPDDTYLVTSDVIITALWKSTAPAPYIIDEPTYYKIILAETENGTATASRSTAPQGAEISITAVPDEGYVLETIRAVDARGSAIPVTDGKFTMPASDVTVTAVFVTQGCKRGDDCPLSAFSDLDPNAWYHDGVHFCLENGIMEGYGNGLFGPNDATTRAMAVTVIWKLEGRPTVNYALPYSDVAEGEWYSDAIRWATSVGIVEGWTDGETGELVFQPDAKVTREAFAAMLYRYAQNKGEGFTGLWSFQLEFPDAGDVSPWAKEAVSWMVMQGVVNGMDGKLNPRGGSSRAMIAAMLYRFASLA